MEKLKKTNNQKKITSSKHEIVTDEHGEVKHEVKNITYQVDSEPPYVKLYIQDIARLHGLPSYAHDVFKEFIGNMGYNNVVPMYKPVKDMICERLKMKINTLNKAVDILYQKGILIRKARGMYIVDPEIAGRGSWKDIKKIRMVIEYGADGKRTINTEISKQLDLFNN